MTNIFVKALVKGPNRITQSYLMYFVNGYKFHTIGHGSGRATMNSGVCIKGTNYSENASGYYGQLIEILELEYPGYPFKERFYLNVICLTLQGMVLGGTQIISLVDVKSRENLIL